MGELRRVVILGGMAQMPFAGIAWQVLHYLEGFRRLGHEVFYVEDTGAWPYDPENDTVSEDAGPGVRRLQAVMQRHGFGGAWAYRDAAREGEISGMSAERFARVIREADVLVNLSGMTVLREEHMAAPVRVYLETDPVTPQLEVAEGREFTIDFLDAHTVHFSFGERLGAPDCPIPVERFTYLPTRQPVVLDWWGPSEGFPGPPPEGMRFTTVANWEQTHRDVEWEGETYTWSKSAEFRRLLDVPARAGVSFEAALAIDDDATVAELEAHGWKVVQVRELSGDPERYREYIRGSGAEFTAAKDQNVRLRSGWFSDRSATYLAAGRPTVVQDTGFDVALPVGEGLLAFLTPDEAEQGLRSVVSDYERHSRAAREIAEEYFRAETVLARLLEAAGA